MTKEDLRLHLRETARMNWIHMPIAIIKEQNFNNTKKNYPISKPNQKINDCPQARPRKNVTIETCRSCLYCVGLSDNHVDCLYDFLSSKDWAKYLFPEFQPIKENFPLQLFTLVKQIRTPFYGYQNNYSYQKKKSYGNRYKSKKGKYKW